MAILFILDLFCAEEKWRFRTRRNCSTLYEKCKMGRRPIWKIWRTSKSCTAEMLLTFPEIFCLFCSTNEMVEGVIKVGLEPWLIKCQAVVSCRHTCSSHRTCLHPDLCWRTVVLPRKSVLRKWTYIPPHFYPNEWSFYFINHLVTEFYFQKCFLTNDEACTKYNFSLLLDNT